APRAVVVEADPEIGGDEPAIVALEFVAGRPVDVIDAEVRTPILAPLGLVTALHDEDEFLDVLRDALDPFVVFGAKLARRGRQELDDRAERTVVAEDGALVGSFAAGRKAARIIPADQLRDYVEVTLEVLHKHRTGEDRVGDR